jgi:endonuclease YncB( thermonuclease family)
MINMIKMKKLLTLSLAATSLLSVGSLASCSSKPKVTNPNQTQICFSGYVQSDYNFAIEIYNFTDEDVDLKWYKLNEYYKAKEDKVTFSLDLKGVLKAHETYVVCSSDSSSEVLEKADCVVEDNSSTGFSSLGTQVFTLTYAGYTVDSLGTVGYRTEWGRDITLMRRQDKWHGVGKNYDYKEWLEYQQDTVEYLGQAEPTITLTELYEGPRWDESYLNTPFANPNNSNVGAGGAVKARMKSTYTIDGDTADFYFYSWDATQCVTNTSYASKLTPTANKPYVSWARSRYYNVDTPESAASTVEPWGLGAKARMNELLKNGHENDTIYLQSVIGGGVTGNYGRLLSYVYADSYLTNFLLVREGLSQPGKISATPNDGMTYKEVPFSTYFKHAEYYAEENGLGIYGQQDPYWDYLQNRPK